MSSICCDECREAKCGLIYVGDFAMCAECVNRKFAALTAELEKRKNWQATSAIAAERDQWKERAGKLEAAWANMRDSILHERHQIAEMGLQSEQVNAVLGVIDDAYPCVFVPQPAAEAKEGQVTA